MFREQALDLFRQGQVTPVTHKYSEKLHQQEILA